MWFLRSGDTVIHNFFDRKFSVNVSDHFGMLINSTRDRKSIKHVLTNNTKFIVAPMVDQSELAWRMLSRRHGAQLCFTPMYNANVIAKDATYRKRVLRDISCSEDSPLVVQFCANTPEQLLNAGRIVESFCDAIDLNLGCPQHIARRGHFGAFLQDSWELLTKMITACSEGLSIPITAKIRIFTEVERTVQYAKMLESAGCAMITVHGRTKEQKGLKTGLADWQQIKAVKKNVGIPVVSNGNVQNLDDIHKCLIETGVDAVMVAESHLTNPCIFLGENPKVYDMACEYLSLVHNYPCPLSFVRAHLFKLWVHSLKVFPEYQEKLGRAHSLDDMGRINEEINQLCLEEEKCKTDHDERLPLSHWICQPHVRARTEKRKEDVEKSGKHISRNQQRRLARYQRKVEHMKVKRQFERERRKERIAELKENDHSGVVPKIYSTSNRSKSTINCKLLKVMEEDINSMKVCIDLSWTAGMNDKEISKLAGQIGRLYGSNRKSKSPASLYFTGFSKESLLYNECVRKHNGFENYKINMTDDTFLSLFDKDNLVYLSPDGEEELLTLDTDHVYILGGLVDETVKKHLSYGKARDNGVSVKRLPINFYMHRSGHHHSYSTVLAINQVFDILLTYYCTKSWRTALAEGMPPRKGYLINDDVT